MLYKGSLFRVGIKKIDEQKLDIIWNSCLKMRTNELMNPI